MLGKSLARVVTLPSLLAGIVLAVPILVLGQASPRVRGSLGNIQRSGAGSEYSRDRDFLPRIIPLPRPVTSRTAGFLRIVRPAGIIFSGTVASVSRAPSGTSQPSQTLAITFHIEQGIRGATSGQDLTIFQWLGVWTGGQRYSVGDHVLLFLYQPSKLGLTSCVGGSLGRFAAGATGKVTLTAEYQAAFKFDWLLAGKSEVVIEDIQRAVLLAGASE
jgi:hypothetical protein